MHKRFQNNSGFTVVEVLVVITIISTLASIAVIGYGAFRKNAQNTQIATTVSAYQNAVSSMTQENVLFEDKAVNELSCISSASDSSVCCFLDHVGAVNNITLGCFDNANIAYFGSPPLATYSASQLSSWTRKYLSASAPPSIPISSNGPACVSSTQMSYSGYNNSLPCATKEIGLQTYISAQGDITSYVVYFLPPDTDCQSKDVATLLPFAAGSPLAASYDNAKYSFRTTSGATPFTFCVVKVR